MKVYEKITNDLDLFIKFVDELNDDGREFIEKIYSSLQGWYEANKSAFYLNKKKG